MNKIYHVFFVFYANYNIFRGWVGAGIGGGGGVKFELEQHY